MAISMNCFGKAPAKHDSRTLPFVSIVREEGALPEEYDFDQQFAATLFPGYKRRGIPTPKFGNDKNPNCVIAGRAHQTLRFELLERGRLIRIPTKAVMDEFHNEGGGDDASIPVLDSLKLWRKVGWNVGGRISKIKAFARVSRRDHEKMKRAIRIKIGVGLGFILPDTAKDQFDNGEAWDVTRDRGSRSMPHKPHYVYVSGYTNRGPLCVTWGRKQQISWAFVNRYCDEAYAIIDAINTPEKKRCLDEKKLNRYLENCARC